jgi:hypothetical protein
VELYFPRGDFVKVQEWISCTSYISVGQGQFSSICWKWVTKITFHTSQ